METESFITQKPKSEVVKKYISYYYFHLITMPNQVKKIIFYPNTINAITIYKNSFLVFTDKFTSTTKPSDKEEYNIFYSGLKKNFAKAEMQSPFDKIGIAFEPLGINNFIKKPVSEAISKNNDWRFTEFGTSIHLTLDKVYATNDIDEKVKLLDNYFLSQLNTFHEELVEKSIQLITASSQKFKVLELANALTTSTKTLNRKFQKHLNCTVKDYIEVAQFRKSFNHFLNENKSEKLTNLAYQFDYYDQSEFIKQFKKITGINPKRLFKNIEHFGDEELFWNTKI